MNDSLRTNVFVRYSPETIACACIYLSARVLKIPLPNNPNWFEIFGVSEEEIEDVCITVLKLYARPKPNQEELEKVIENLRKEHENAKLRAKELLTENGTPTSQTQDNSPLSRTNSPLIKQKSVQSPLKNSLKSIPSIISQTNSPNKKRSNDSPLVKKRSKSKSRSVSPITRNDNYEKNNVRERVRSPPKSYANDYYSRSPEKDRRSHHKHKRITYSRSRSRSPTHSRHHYHDSKHHSYSSSNSSNRRKSRKRSKSPNDRNSYHSRSRRSRSRDLYDYRKS